MRHIQITGIKQNNLKNIDVEIPLGQMTVICGPSGSGKSSLAFETLFAEGQRRFIESMSNYARQFLNKAPKPDIESINNIPPAISIEQKNNVKSSRSTVGTTTELLDYFRLLYEKIGVPYCPTHHVVTHKHSPSSGTDLALEHFSKKRGYILVEVTAKNRLFEGKKLTSQLIQDGYLRYTTLSESNLTQIKLNEIIDLSEPQNIKKPLPKETFYIVVDRVIFDINEKGRLVDSITQAFDVSLKYVTGALQRKALIVTTEGQFLKLSEEASCAFCDHVSPPLQSQLFSFNSPMGACPKCKGFGNVLELDKEKVIPNPQLTIHEGALHPFSMPSAVQDFKALLLFCKKNKISTDTPWNELSEVHQNMIWNGTSDFFGVKGLFEYLEQMKYKMHVRVFISRYRTGTTCPDCNGSRLRSDVNFIKVHQKSINDINVMTLEELNEYFNQIQFSNQEIEIAHEIIKQIKSRLNFLMRVGVHYLTLSRETKTLSGGEYQRLMLANQLGMGLSQTLYVLDEPTVGLHPRDNDRLISILKDLKNLGNTLVIVEHDHDVIKNAESILEMGPGSGIFGGDIVFQGSTEEFYKSKNSNTASFLLDKKHNALKNRIVDLKLLKHKITLKNCTGHNLKNITVDFPLNRLVTVTGVSGSGKSTLVSKTLYPALARALNVEFISSQPFKEMTGHEQLKNVLLIDQSAIGKSARSSPVTYLKIFDHIRNLFAKESESVQRGYSAGTFSLNVDGGRCPSCKGTGFEEIDMQFMDNVLIPCDVCDGKKYRPEILEITFQQKNIHEVLQMTVAQAMDFFVTQPQIRKALLMLKEVGLDYIALGQPASSLSGGESQRLKIAKELFQVQQKSTLYILDEPTTGLHFKEIELLMKVLHKLIDSGGSVLVVEHNLDVIRNSDFIIDLGPDAGDKGGTLVVQGPPEAIMKEKNSLTGQYLKSYLGVS